VSCLDWCCSHHNKQKRVIDVAADRRWNDPRRLSFARQQNTRRCFFRSSLSLLRRALVFCRGRAVDARAVSRGSKNPHSPSPLAASKCRRAAAARVRFAPRSAGAAEKRKARSRRSTTTANRQQASTKGAAAARQQAGSRTRSNHGVSSSVCRYCTLKTSDGTKQHTSLLLFFISNSAQLLPDSEQVLYYPTPAAWKSKEPDRTEEKRKQASKEPDSPIDHCLSSPLSILRGPFRRTEIL